MYKLNLTYENGAFAVPNDLTDKYLKLAPSAGFKVLLFILRNPEGAGDIQQISFCTGLSESDVRECIEYWTEQDVIKQYEGTDEAKSAQAVANIKTIQAEKPEGQNHKKTVAAKMPTQGEVAKRLEEEPQLSEINTEAQLIIGSYGLSMQQVIVLLFDYYGFSPEIIITLLQYQKDLGNASPNAVKQRAEDWAKRGIDSLELVAREIQNLETIRYNYCIIREELKIPNKNPAPRIAKYLREWCIDWEFSSDVIIYALNKNGKSFSEASKMLKKCMLSGIKSIEEIKEKEKKSISNESDTTFDISQIGKNSALDLIKRFETNEV